MYFFVFHSYMEQTLSLPEIDEFRNGIIALLKHLELKKQLIRSHDRTKLVNHLNFSLEVLDNMVNIKKVEMADPYNRWNAQPTTNYMLDPRANIKNVIYNPDGTTRIIDNASRPTNQEEWTRVFDESQLINPPCFMMPPQNLSSIQRIKSANLENRLAVQVERRKPFWNN